MRTLFSGEACEGLFSWLAAHGLVAKFPNGAPTVTGIPVSILWFILFDAIHHRGQLTTYIRPMGGKVPPVYGPSGDSR